MAIPKRWLIIRVKRHIFLSVLFIFSISFIIAVMVYKWHYWISNFKVVEINTVHLKHYLLHPSTEKTKSMENKNINQRKHFDVELKQLKASMQKAEHVHIKGPSDGNKVPNSNVVVKHRKPYFRPSFYKVKNYYMAAQGNHNTSTKPNYDIHIFYYVWYGNLVVDGEWLHWDHKYLSNWKREDKRIYPTGTHHPPDDISSNFYPALGCYSSRDPVIIETHMRQLREANIGVVIVSWYPPGMSDSEGGSADLLMPLLLDIAHKYDLKVAPHIEPYQNRNPINLLEYLQYIVNHYGSHPALYNRQHRGKRLPVYYVYDSYLTPSGTWKELLSSKGNLSVRGTKFDGIFIGLLVDVQHRYEIKKAHFDDSLLQRSGESLWHHRHQAVCHQQQQLPAASPGPSALPGWVLLSEEPEEVFRPITGLSVLKEPLEMDTVQGPASTFLLQQ